MAFHLTVTQTAFAVPVGVILGALLAYLGTRKASKEALDAQKEAIRTQVAINQSRVDADERLALERHAHDERLASERLAHEATLALNQRLFGERFRLYAEIAAFLEASHEYLKPWQRPPEFKIVSLEQDKLSVSLSMVEMIGGREVRQQADLYRSSFIDLLVTSLENGMSNKADGWPELCQKLTSRGSSFIVSMREELQQNS